MYYYYLFIIAINVIPAPPFFFISVTPSFAMMYRMYIHQQTNCKQQKIIHT